MPDTKISALTAATEIRVGDELPIARSGLNFKVTGKMLSGREYESRGSNTILGVADIGKVIDITAAITQTFEADETLGDGWWVLLKNSAGVNAVVTLDPAAGETIDGAATLSMQRGDARIVICNGAGGNFNTLLIPPPISYAKLEDQKTAATGGGTATSGSWETRTLNTEVADPDGIVSLAANQFTLGAGVYVIRASAPAYKVNSHHARVRNVTDGTTAVLLSTAYTSNADGVLTESQGSGLVSITGSKAFELQHRVQTTVATVGYGPEANFDEGNIYGQVEIWKLR